VFNQELPSFDKDFRASIEGMEVPLVTHEVGQYSVYPDLTEIPKYTGTLMPLERMGLSVIRRHKMGRREIHPQLRRSNGVAQER